MSSQRKTVRRAIKKQPDYNPKLFLEKMTALYDSRITTAANARDLQGVQQDILRHKTENRRLRFGISLLANVGALASAAIVGGSGAFAAAAATANLVPGAGLITVLVVGFTAYFAGNIVWSAAQGIFTSEKEAHDKIDAENNALGTLENKLQQKLALTPPDPSNTSAATPRKPSLLSRLHSIFRKAAAKPASLPEAAPPAPKKTPQPSA